MQLSSFINNISPAELMATAGRHRICHHLKTVSKNKTEQIQAMKFKIDVFLKFQ